MWATEMRWSSWTHSYAYGRAHLTGSDFSRFSLGSANLHFYRTIYSDGRWHFTRLHITCTSRTCSNGLGARYFGFEHGTWLVIPPKV
jgi:hypothetical protein